LEETGNGLGIFAVALGLGPVDGFHGPGVTEDEGDVVVAAGVGEPVPAVDALAGDEESLAEGLHSAEEGVGLGGQVFGEAGLSVVVKDDEEEGPGVQVDAGIKSGVGGGLEGTHGEGLRVEVRWRRLGAISIFAHESLHEYPTTAADRGCHY